MTILPSHPTTIKAQQNNTSQTPKLNSTQTLFKYMYRMMQREVYSSSAYSHVAEAAALDQVAALAAESAVAVFGVGGCCMCHAVERLFRGMGVSPAVHQLDRHAEAALCRLLGGCPVVFVGGKLLGAVDQVMASHINGSLVPLLKDAGALWL